MPKQETLPIGPWPKGINNVDDPKSAVFQLSDETLPPLTKAQNVDFDRQGFVRRRVGRTKCVNLSSAHSLYSSNSGRLFLIDAGTLKEVLPDFTLRTVDIGLGDHPMSFAEAGGVIFYANEAKVGAVDGFWGIPMPSSPFIVPTTGTMPAGRYFCAVTGVRGTVESGARQPTVISLETPGGLAVSLAGLDSNLSALNIYLSEPNGQTPYFLRQTAVANSLTIDELPQTKSPLKTFGHYPPMLGQRIAKFRGRMLIAAGSTLYWSQPLAYHHYRVQADAQLFADRIILLGALDSGFFLGLPDRTYWVQGAEPNEWMPRLVDTRRNAEGDPLRLPAHKLPSLQSQGEVLVWATEDGFVAGTGDGTIHYLNDGRVAVDQFQRASLAFREESGLRQILMTLQGKAADTRVGVADRMTCKVIRADEAVGEP